MARHATGFALALLVAACSGAKPIPPDATRGWVPVLEDGKTTAEEVLLALGIPTAEFEGERIFTYRLLVHGDHEIIPAARQLSLTWADDPRLAAWPDARTVNLVLVFDERHVLVRHRFVEVK